VHSWNGKHRRGADLWTPTYNTPMRDSLLWVYEGQTQFWGWVLAARSGLLTREQSLEALAIVAAVYDNRAGRSWRPLADTTFGPILSARRPQPWTDWQRGEDYYQEGQLVWLDADQLIRERSNGARSLDDFAKAFFGGPGGRATVSTYTFEDVVAALNAVEPYDWAAFLRERVDAFGTKAPLGGVTRGGYRLVYRETPSSLTKADEAARKVTDLSWSLGMVLNSEGKVSGVRWEGPAYKAGMTTGGMVTAVNGAAYTADKLKAAVTAAKAGAPLELLVKAGDRYRTYKLEHRGGLRYPHLERVGTGPARLDALLTAR
jgi:predicted metalloprotease with PDZ domain